MENKDDELEKILKELKEEKKSDFSLQVEDAAGKAEDSLPEKKEEAPLKPEITEEPINTIDAEIEADLKEAAQEAAEEEKATAAEEAAPLPFEVVNSNEEEYAEEDIDMPKNNKKVVIIVAAVVVIIAIAVGVYFAFFNKPAEEPTTVPPETTTQETTTEAPVVIMNPLTGSTDFNAEAVGKRPVAVVVENAAAARPQYNMDTPDIIVEGEVEGGITRMLWLYADMTDLPEQVGPTRSARPPYVKFSEFFDSIFVHFGESHSKGAYTGADDVIVADGVDNINGMTTSSCFKRTSDNTTQCLSAASLLRQLTARATEKTLTTLPSPFSALTKRLKSFRKPFATRLLLNSHHARIHTPLLIMLTRTFIQTQAITSSLLNSLT